MSIGKNISLIRKSKKLTQANLAKEIGISRSYLSDLENDRKNPSAKTLKNLAEKLNVRMINLIEENDTDFIDNLEEKISTIAKPHEKDSLLFELMLEDNLITDNSEKKMNLDALESKVIDDMQAIIKHDDGLALSLRLTEFCIRNKDNDSILHLLFEVIDIINNFDKFDINIDDEDFSSKITLRVNALLTTLQNKDDMVMKEITYKEAKSILKNNE